MTDRVSADRGAAVHLSEDPARVRISATTLGDLLLTAYDRAPDKEALVFPEGRKTYGALVEAALHKARALLALGVGPGDHVGVLLPSGIAFVETLFANAMVGAVSVLMNARYKAPEMAYVADNADLVAIVTDDTETQHVNFTGRLGEAFPDLAAQADPAALALAAAPRLRRIVVLHAGDAAGTGRVASGCLGQDAFDAAAATIPVAAVHHRRLCVRLRDTAMILYTSGTSANPKGCLLSHEASVREGRPLAAPAGHFDAIGNKVIAEVVSARLQACGIDLSRHVNDKASSE